MSTRLVVLAAVVGSSLGSLGCGGDAHVEAASPAPVASASARASVGAAPPADAAPATPPAVDEAFARVLKVVADPSDDAIRAAFSPAFLGAIPPDQVKAFYTKLRGEAGACKGARALEVPSPNQAVLRADCDARAMQVAITVNAAAPHLVDGIRWSPALPDAVEVAMRRWRAFAADPGDATLRAAYAPAMVDAMGAHTMIGSLTQVRTELGPCTEQRALEVKGTTAAVLRVQCAHGALKLWVDVDPAPPNLIVAMKIEPTQ